MVKNYIYKLIYKGFSRKKKGLKQIIICGFPRSGTSLMFNYVSSITPKEIRPFTGKKSTTKEFSGIYLLRRLRSYITKRPEDCFKLNEIAQWNVKDKKILIIVCVRDIRNLAVSKHHKKPEEYYLDLNERWFIEKNILRPNGLIQFHNTIKKIIEKKDFYEKKNVFIKLVRYEDFTKDKKMINDFLKTHHIPITEINGEVKLPYTGKEVGKGDEGDFSIKIDSQKWLRTDKDKNRVKELFEKDPEFFQEALEFYGYEENDKWQETLKTNQFK